MKKYKVGSSLFFDGLPGFTPKDYDYLLILDEWPGHLNSDRIGLHREACDILFMKQETKDEYIQKTLETQSVYRAFNFFVPQFCEFLGITIQDLACIEPIMEKVRETRHSYYLIILEAYKKNGGFFLTDEQRTAAYQEYQKTRNHHALSPTHR